MTDALPVRTDAGREALSDGPTPAARVIIRGLESLPIGSLRLRWIDGSDMCFGGRTPGPEAAMVIHDRTVPRRVLAGGSMGLAETYIEGLWSTPDLPALLVLAAENVRALNAGARWGLPYLPGAFTWPLDRLRHLARRNSRRGARRNIEAHYDLSDGFYSLWLDPELTYSCAIWGRSDEDLAVAQRRKWDRLLDLLEPMPGPRLLEIGCGWGGFAVHAAKTRDLRVTGITISPSQHRHAVQWVREEGLEGQVDIRLRDYRDVTETYSGVVSIEMFEAVGERYWPAFFSAIRDRLEPGAAAALQVITIDDAVFGRYRRRADFIQKHIFPGGMLPSPSAFERAARRAGLAPGPTTFHGRDYALTLERWLERFESRIHDIRALGFDVRFERLWRYYLAYCRAVFMAGKTDLMQVRLGPSAASGRRTETVRRNGAGGQVPGSKPFSSPLIRLSAR